MNSLANELQFALKNKAELLEQLKQKPTTKSGQQAGSHKFIDYLSESKQNTLHLLSTEVDLKDAGSLVGNTDMTLYSVIEALLKAKKALAFRQDRDNGYTPLHSAFKSGNLEVALWIMAVLQNNFGPDTLNELINTRDNDGMRPVDLLAFRVDDDHKHFLKEFHKNEKNYKVKKQYEAYSWGRSDDFQLGYPSLADEKSKPRRINFAVGGSSEGIHEEGQAKFVFDSVSIRDIVCSRNYSLALSDEGEVFSWGCGALGQLGSGSDQSRVYPEKIKFKQFKDEQKKINRVKSEVNVGDGQLDQVEDLLFRKKFLKRSSVNSDKHQAIIDQQCLMQMQHLTQDSSQIGGKNKKMRLMQNLADGSLLEEQTEVKLALMRMDRVCVTKIACSNKHSLACTNTGALFTWGQNDHGQLGIVYHKANETQMDNCLTPRRIEGQGKLFFIDVACGDNHSLALCSSREAYVWGSNKYGQLGFNPELYTQVSHPRKLILHEYMNSSNKEVFTAIKAKANYSVLIAESKHIYISSPSSEQPFMPLFGKQQSQQNSRRNHLGSLKKLEQAVYLSESYLLCMDQYRSIYYYRINQVQAQQQADLNRKIATEVFNGSSFIELHPTERSIWALNSLRQLFVCKGESFQELTECFKKSNQKAVQIQFEPINAIFNVMKACMGDKHQVVIKIVKQLDSQMLRDIQEEQKMPDMPYPEDSDGSFEIPTPTFQTSAQEPPKEKAKPKQQKGPFMPSLADNCIKVISNNLCIENALQMLENADKYNIEELKINSLKFIALNIVSFLESSYLEKIYQLPVYLIRELENFLKISSIDKFRFWSMTPFDQIVYDTLEAQAQKQAELEMLFVGGGRLPSQQYCMETYNSLLNMRGLRSPDDLDDVYRDAVQFRNLLRKSIKQTRKSSMKESLPGERRLSTVSDGPTDTETAVVGEYLKLVQEFIRSIAPASNSANGPTEEQETIIDESPVNLEEEEEEVKEQPEVKPVEDGPNQIIVRKKRKGGRRNRAGNVFADRKPDQFETIQTDLDKFSLPLFEKNPSHDNDFLSKDKDPKKAEIDFEKKAIAEDFTVVKDSQKRNGKNFTNNSKNQEAFSKDSESSENRTLAELIGFDQKSLNKKREELKKQEDKVQADLRKKIWNYLGDGQDASGGKSSRAGTLTEATGPKLSFEEIMREEQAKKPIPRRSTIDVSKHGKDFESKNAWGMKQDDQPVTDFGLLIEEEKKKAKQEASLLKEQHDKDLAFAKELQKQLLERDEEELLKKAIEASLKHDEEMSMPLAKDCIGMPMKQQSKTKGGRRNRGKKPMDGQQSLQEGQESQRKSARGQKQAYKQKNSQQ